MLTRYKAFQIGLILVGDVCFLQQAAALGLGELEVESALSEPLDVSIELLDVAGLDPSQISVTLGSQEDFTSAGAELVDLASQVQFRIETSGTTGRIHLTTPDAVDEPFLNLILNVRWPAGTLQREYTILLNLPGTVASDDSPFTIPTVSNSRPVVAPDAETSLEEESPANSRDADATERSEDYRVETGDSMWAIAGRTRPNSDVGMQQMMLAIQRANQGAFINNNINRIKAGEVLRIPTLQEINLLDQNTAIDQITQQNQDVAVQPLAVNRAVPSTNPDAGQDELTVLTDDQSKAGTAGNADPDAAVAGLENELMMSEENLDRARLENLELTGRFKMLEEELDILQNLIAIEDTRVTQLQAELSTQGETAEQALATTQAASSVLAAQQSEQQPGITGNVSGWLQNTVVMLGAIVGLFLLILGYLFWQRRRMTAQVYAFDSGIPELETMTNSTFAPAGKSRSGIMGWFSGRDRSKPDISAETTFATDSRRLDQPVTFAGNAAAVEIGDLDNPELHINDEDLRILDGIHSENNAAVNEVNLDGADLTITREQFPGSSFQNDPETSPSWHSDAISPTVLNRDAQLDDEQLDDAELADVLIAEAKDTSIGTVDLVNEPVSAAHAGPEPEQDEATLEAEALTALMVPDIATTGGTDGIPDSFEFTLESMPDEPVAEHNPESIGNETFDFQLSQPTDQPAPLDLSADRGMTDEEIQLSALTLDEDDSELQHDASTDESDTKLDLAVAYEAMGDIDGALEILDEVLSNGNSTQIAEARRLQELWRNS